MSRPLLEVADIFRRYGSRYRQQNRCSKEQLVVMRAIENCRTEELGGHVDECDRCGYRAISYNSCRNRHCPKCGWIARTRWLEERKLELLPVEYFHVVFTIPDHLAPLALQNKRIVYNILFAAVSRTLLTVAADRKHLGARIGFSAVLHTWGQTLTHHPHIHCVVPNGGISHKGRKWVFARAKHFLFPIRVLSKLFRGKFLAMLKEAFQEGKLRFHGLLTALSDPKSFNQYLRKLYRVNWVVYCKPPFGGPERVLKYLCRYTHRIAISNDRLLSIENGAVSFRYKDYRDGSKIKVMTLQADEFIRRFLMHIVPARFVRIRHYGFLANAARKRQLDLCRQLLDVPVADSIQQQDWKVRYHSLVGQPSDQCPKCIIGRMVQVEILTQRMPALDSS